MASEIGFVVVGLGMGYSRAKVIARTAGARLVGVADVDGARAARVAEELGCEWATDYQQFLRRDDVDVVGAWTPTGLHGTVCLDVLKAGKHAITTKPMDTTLARCDEIIEAARKANRLLVVDFGNRYESDVRAVRQAILAGGFGRLLFADARLKWWRAQSYYDRGQWRGTWAMDGGGSVMNQGVHYVDALLWLMGPVDRVEYARSAVLAHQIETEDATQAVLTFKNGAWGTIETTTTHYPSLPTAIEIHGTGGSAVRIEDEPIAWKFVDESGQERTYEPPSEEWAPSDVAADVVSALTRGTAVACDGVEGRRSVALITAIYEAARTGKSVTPAE
ncbi:MAG TPA: Gfo/Idh/MocA family oxidoreductase [Chloroflexota bacterium]|nr:Gfo/Idh/MocA family oxidoreductase [Chloroflexota bacterium]